MLKRASVPATWASPPALVVCVCLVQIARAWKIATMPIRPIATPTMISTSVKPRERRRCAGAMQARMSRSVDVGHQRVPAPGAVAGGLPAQGDHDAVEGAGAVHEDLLVRRGGAGHAGNPGAVGGTIQ